MSWAVTHDDCLDVLRALPDACVDAVVTDPPAGISFMGKTWDKPGTYGFDGERVGAPPTVNLARNPTCQTCGGRRRGKKACACATPQFNDVELRLRDAFAFIDFLSEVMAECLRVLKPGGHALVWSLPRTSHWIGTAIDLAGFEVRDCISHLYGSGFPKSLNVSKSIDSMDGLKSRREVVSTYTAGGNAGVSTADKGGTYGVGVGTAAPVELAITKGASERSRAWDGWGTALKPACEMWWLARKPLAGTVARNVLEFGTGALNVDGCRIGGGEPRPHRGAHSDRPEDTASSYDLGSGYVLPDMTTGRWPANMVLSHAPECREVGTRTIKRTTSGYNFDSSNNENAAHVIHNIKSGVHYGTETVPAFECAPDCPVAMLDAQSGNRPGMSGGGKHRPDATPGMFGKIDCEHTARADQGGASRFFATFHGDTCDDLESLGVLECDLSGPRFLYQSKTSTREREAGCEHLPKRSAAELTNREPDTDGLNSPRAGAGRTSSGRANGHPTVKSIALMRWLCRLITPPNGTILDPFCGSGSTGCAAVLEGFHFAGIDQDADYCEIARARIAHWEKQQ